MVAVAKLKPHLQCAEPYALLFRSRWDQLGGVRVVIMGRLLPEDRINRDVAARSGVSGFLNEIEHTIHVSREKRVLRGTSQSDSQLTPKIKGSGNETSPRGARFQ